MASFTSRLLPASDAQDDVPRACDSPLCTPPAQPTSISTSTNTTTTTTTATAGSSPDVLLGQLQTFLTERRSQAPTSGAFATYVDASLQGLPASIRRTTEFRIIEVLHECQNQADRQQFRPIQPQQTSSADGQRPRNEEYLARRPREYTARQWQPSPSMWPAEVSNPPDL